MNHKLSGAHLKRNNSNVDDAPRNTNAEISNSSLSDEFIEDDLHVKNVGEHIKKTNTKPDAENNSDEDEAQNTKSVAKSTATMSVATLLSRATGFFRTWACAFALGNTVLSSAYQVANNMPNMLYELVAGGILTTAFLPVYLTELENRGKKAAGNFAGNLMGIGAIVLGAVALLATIFAPQVIATQTFMSSSQEDVELAIFFFRFFAIQVLFYGVGAIISGILNGHKSFLWPALGPVFNNVVVIATMFVYVFVAPIDATLAKSVLACGTSLGVLVMMCVQIPALIKLKIPIKLHVDFKDPTLIRTLKIALPATVFVVVNLVVVSVRNSFSLGVASNGPSTLSYAWLWYQFPYGVIAVALSTAMLTEMSSAAAVKDWPLFRRNVKSGLSGTMFLIMPLAVLMIVLAFELVNLYHAGQFTADDVAEVTVILRVWALSLPFYAGYMYMYRSFSAMQDLGMVTWIDAAGRIVQAALYAILTTAGGENGLGLAGIPLADFVFYFTMFFVLCFIMRKKIGEYGLKTIFSTILKTVVASAVTGVVAWLLHAFAFSWVTLPGSSIATSIFNIVIIGIAGLAAFYVVCKLLRMKEASLIGSVVGKVGKKLKH